MSEFYGSADEGEATATIRRALKLGVTFLDTHPIAAPADRVLALEPRPRG